MTSRTLFSRAAPRAPAGGVPSSRALGGSQHEPLPLGAGTRLPPLPQTPHSSTPLHSLPEGGSSSAATHGGVVSPGGTLAWIPSRLPFRCSSVQLRGGPLLQGVEVTSTRLHLDLHRATLNVQLQWADAHTTTASTPNGSPAFQHLAHPSSAASTPRPAAASSSVAVAAAPPGSGLVAPSSGKKRVRVHAAEEEGETDECEQLHSVAESLARAHAQGTGQPPEAAHAHIFGASALQTPLGLGIADSANAATAATTTVAFPTPSCMPAQPPSSKRGRTDERVIYGGVSTAASPATLALPSFSTPLVCGPSASPSLSSSPALPTGPVHSVTHGGLNKSLWSIPLSHVVGVDFAISLDQPATCTLALKPHCVYANDAHCATTPHNQQGQQQGQGQFHTPAGPGFLSSPASTGAASSCPRRAHMRHPSAGSTLASLPAYSPARILVSSYNQMASRNPQRFSKLTLFIQRALPPLWYFVWLHSTYAACAFLFGGLLAMHWRFWLTSMTCLLLYLILLLQQFRRSQGEFAHRLCCARAPHEEVQYVHLVFAHEAYTSFLSFRRLFVAAAPAFSAPSASSSGATALIPPSLPSSLLWSPTRSAVPSRYPISHLQHVLPVAPLFFGNVYVDFICYLLFPPRVFASARVRSLTHFLLPVLYLGQAMVAAVRALTPVAVQGCVILAPYVHLELLWFVSMLDAFPNPLSFLHLLLPVQWIRSVLAQWLLELGALAVRSWGSVTATLYMLSAPFRWLNALLSPVLELIRQEARALWGLSVLLQPLVALLLRVQTELVRAWGAFSAVLAFLGSTVGGLVGGLVPVRLFALFGAVRSSASATAAVGSGISASGVSLSRWRVLWQNAIEWGQLIGKWKLVVDRIRLNIQLWYYERFVHVRDAQNLAGTGSNPNLAVPLVQALERTASELVSAAEGEGAEAGGDGGGDGLSVEEAEENEGRNKLLLTPRRPLTPSEAHRSSGNLSVDTAAPSSPDAGGSLHGLGLGMSSRHGSRRGSVSFGALLPNVSVMSPPSSRGSVHLPPPPTFTLSPLQSEPPIFAVAADSEAMALPDSSPPMLSANVAEHIGPTIPAQRPPSSSSSSRRASLQGSGLLSSSRPRTPAGLAMGARFSGFEDGFEALLLQGAAQLSSSDKQQQKQQQQQQASRPASPAPFASPFSRTDLPHPASFSRADIGVPATAAAEPDDDVHGAMPTDHNNTLRHRRKDSDGTKWQHAQAEQKER